MSVSIRLKQITFQEGQGPGVMNFHAQCSLYKVEDYIYILLFSSYIILYDDRL